MLSFLSLVVLVVRITLWFILGNHCSASARVVFFWLGILSCVLSALFKINAIFSNAFYVLYILETRYCIWLWICEQCDDVCWCLSPKTVYLYFWKCNLMWVKHYHICIYSRFCACEKIFKTSLMLCGRSNIPSLYIVGVPGGSVCWFWINNNLCIWKQYKCFVEVKINV